jgi:uncharacterized protein with gpF-like domain
MTQPVEPPVESTGLNDAVIAAMIAAFAVLVLAALTRWLAKARAAVMRNGDPGAILTLDADWSREIDNLMPDLLRAARRGWEETARQLGLDLPFNPRDPIILEQLERTRNLLVRVDDGVYRMVIRAIADGTDKGESKQQISARIDNILDITGSENWPNRADVIARTEVGRFTEAGSLSAAQRFQVRTTIRLLKEWVDKDDARVRSAHSRVDGKRLPLRGLFEVGRSLLRYPKDPAGAPKDVIDCRCRLKFLEVRNG